MLSCYLPVTTNTPIPQGQQQLSNQDWARFYHLVRTDKKKAFELYAEYYLGTSGQLYWSDGHQLSNAFEGYRQAVDEGLGTEMITEVYVPKQALVPFLAQARRDFIEHKVDMTYGTIRLIEPDSESFLAWASETLVCIVCNLHVTQTEAGKQKARQDFFKCFRIRY